MQIDKEKKAVTLMEMLIVIIIIGIFATIGMGYFNLTSESVYDKEAKAMLKLLRAAEECHMIDLSAYYPSAGNTANIADINTNLKIGIPNNSRWTYTVYSNGCSQAVMGSKNWFLVINDVDGEPDSGICP